MKQWLGVKMPSPIVQIRIPQELLDQAKAQAEADRRSFSAWVRLLIEDRLNGAHVELFPKGTTRIDGSRYRLEGVVNSSTLEPTLEYGCENCGNLWSLEDKNRLGGLCGPCFDEGFRRYGMGTQAAEITQPQERPALRPEKAVRQLRDADKPKRKPKACKHTNQIRKLGRPYCTDCGEFV